MTPGILPEYFTPNCLQQLNLFDSGQPRANSVKLINILDGINPG